MKTELLSTQRNPKPCPLASAMPQHVDPLAVDEYAAAFGKEPHLLSVGFSFLIDITGTLFKKKKPALKDLNGNTQAFGSIR